MKRRIDMKGDRVQITSAMLHTQADEVLPVYGPAKLQNGQLKESYDGSYEFQRLGGVKAGTTGTIQGPPLKIHRTQLMHLQQVAGTAALGGSNDYVNMFPVMLDYYQQVGWFPVDHIRIVSGDVLR
jgi:hypothetical protein